ncbi:MAG TPA: AMIN domain-containing protein [Terriglobales bacterium]|nr:AMIN domain-containing protein [Terriglobales bacterium]
MQLIGLLPAGAQSTPPLSSTSSHTVKSPAIIQAVGVALGKDGPTLEIITTGSPVPAIQKLENPLRLVIDLPDSTVVMKKKYVDYRSLEVAAIRVNQFQNSPPITRIVVDLLKPMNYTWDSSGNRLMVRLHSGGEASAQSASVIGLSNEGQSVVPVSAANSGSVVLAGNRLTTGSSVTAGGDAAVLNLGRGGQVRVCPGTTVSVTTSPNGRDLMLGMSTGSLEAHYNLQSSADSVLTPDFRILLAGPGEFHYAIKADSRGNTCVQALPGNTASAIVSELIGDGTYQVKPAEQVLFRSGHLTTVDGVVPGTCGCPAPNNSLLLASEPANPTLPEKKLPESMQLSSSREEAKPAAQNSETGTPADSPNSQVTVTAAGPETASLPASQASDVHVQVEAPFVFRASDLPPVGAPPSVPISEAATLPAISMPHQSLPTTVVLSPPATDSQKKTHHGFFGKVKSLFTAVFG